MPDLDLSLLSCPVCLELLDGPVTVACGHSFCRVCILSHWGQQRSLFTCPLCLKVYYRKSGLVKNFVLSALVERLRAPPAGLVCAPPCNVRCGLCVGRGGEGWGGEGRGGERAGAHLDPRQDAGRKRKARLMGAPSYTPPPSKALTAGVSRHRLLQDLQHKQAELERTYQEAQHIHRNARETLQRVEELFSQMLLMMEAKRRQVKEQVSLHQKNQLRRLQQLQDGLQVDIAELKRSLAQLDPLDTEQDVDDASPAPKLIPEPSGAPSFSEQVGSAVSALVLSVQAPLLLFTSPEPEPNTRAAFLTCACDITMDPHSAHTSLSLSADNREVTLRGLAPGAPDHPHRFTHYRQVLSTEALSGRKYWEVEWSGESVRIALCYRDMQRHGASDACAFGYNPNSWAVESSDGSFSFWFNKERVRAPGPGGPASRLGVFLDHSVGLVSFYSVSHTMNLLHRLQTSFSQPLHVGVWFYWGYHGDTVYFPKLQHNPFIQLICK